MENSRETQLTSGAETQKNFATQNDEKDGATKSGRRSPLLFSSLLFFFLCNREICELLLLQGTRQQKEGEDDPSSKIMNWRLPPLRMRKLFFMGISHLRRDWIGVINFATVIICCIGGLSPTGGVCSSFLGNCASQRHPCNHATKKRVFCKPPPPFFFFFSPNQ
jgi:hypothetical protein